MDQFEDCDDALSAISQRAAKIAMSPWLSPAAPNASKLESVSGRYTVEVPTPCKPPANLQPPPLRYPETLGTLIEIRDAPDGKGKGVFALKDIEPGTILLCEAPLITLIDRGTRADPLDAAVNALSPQQKTSFYSLHAFTRKRNEPLHRQIVYSNGYSIMDDLATGVFETASRINHSCVPNSLYAWVEEGDMATNDAKPEGPARPNGVLSSLRSLDTVSYLIDTEPKFPPGVNSPTMAICFAAGPEEELMKLEKELPELIQKGNDGDLSHLDDMRHGASARNSKTRQEKEAAPKASKEMKESITHTPIAPFEIAPAPGSTVGTKDQPPKYEKEFLLQFQKVATAKPSSMSFTNIIKDEEGQGSKKGRMVFYNRFTLLEGEEVTVDYGHKKGALLRMYGFECQCGGCTEWGSVVSSSSSDNGEAAGKEKLRGIEEVMEGLVIGGEKEGAVEG